MKETTLEKTLRQVEAPTLDNITILIQISKYKSVTLLFIEVLGL